jgi:predicted ATP-dependent Lon-type protease
VERAIAKHDKTLLDAGQVDGHRVSSYGVGDSSKNVLARLLALAKVNRGRPGQEQNSVGRFVTLRKTVVPFADALYYLVATWQLRCVPIDLHVYIHPCPACQPFSCCIASLLRCGSR